VLLGGAILPWDVPALKNEGICAVVNLCAEFSDPIEALERQGITHLDLPTFDRHAPDPVALKKGIDFLLDNAKLGAKTYVHCASGAGRSATLVTCYLIEKGIQDVEATKLLRHKRPAVGLTKKQELAVLEYQRGKPTAH